MLCRKQCTCNHRARTGRPSECDDVIRRAHVSINREQQPTLHREATDGWRRPHICSKGAAEATYQRPRADSRSEGCVTELSGRLATLVPSPVRLRSEYAAGSRYRTLLAGHVRPPSVDRCNEKFPRAFGFDGFPKKSSDFPALATIEASQYGSGKSGPTPQRTHHRQWGWGGQGVFRST